MSVAKQVATKVARPPVRDQVTKSPRSARPKELRPIRPSASVQPGQRFGSLDPLRWAFKPSVNNLPAAQSSRRRASRGRSFAGFCQPDLGRTELGSEPAADDRFIRALRLV